MNGRLITRDQRLCCAMVDRVFIGVCGERVISDASWIEFLDNGDVLAERCGFAHATLTFVPYASVSPYQRRLAAERTRTKPALRNALLSSSAAVRIAMNSVAKLLFGKIPYRAFRPEESRIAFEWLREECSFDVEAALREFEELCRACGIDRL